MPDKSRSRPVLCLDMNTQVLQGGAAQNTAPGRSRAMHASTVTNPAGLNKSWSKEIRRSKVQPWNPNMRMPLDTAASPAKSSTKSMSRTGLATKTCHSRCATIEARKNRLCGRGRGEKRLLGCGGRSSSSLGRSHRAAAGSIATARGCPCNAHAKLVEPAARGRQEFGTRMVCFTRVPATRRNKQGEIRCGAVRCGRGPARRAARCSTVRCDAICPPSAVRCRLAQSGAVRRGAAR